MKTKAIDIPDKFTTREAVLFVLTAEMVRSQYALAKALDVNSIMITNYIHKGTRMGSETAKKFTSLYNLEISDIYHRRKNYGALDTPTSDS